MSQFQRQPRRRSSLSDSVSDRSRNRQSFDVASSFGGLAVLPQVRRTSRERLSTIVSQDGDERTLAKQAKDHSASSSQQDDVATNDLITENEEDVPRRSHSRKLHPDSRGQSGTRIYYSREPNLAASSPVLGQFWTPSALLRPASSYRQLRTYFIERQLICFNNLCRLPAAPDSGWGWIIVLVAAFITSIIEGIAFSFAPILIHLTSENTDAMLQILFMGATLISARLLVCPLAMSLVNGFGCRCVLFAGSTIASAGFLFSWFLYDGGYFLSLIFSYGALGGIGFGLMGLAAIVGVSQYFELNRGLAMGLALCGSGFGTLLFPPLITWLLARWGFGVTATVLAGAALNGCWAALLLRPLSPSLAPELHPRRLNAPSSLSEENNLVCLRQLSQNSSASSSNGDPNNTCDNPEGHTKVSRVNETSTTPNSTENAEESDVSLLKAQLAVVLPPPAILAAARSDRHVNRAHLRQQQLLWMNRHLQNLRQPLSPNRSLVSLSDLTRPFYRVDILYGRSVSHLPRCHTEMNMVDYRASVFHIPEDTWSRNANSSSPCGWQNGDADQRSNNSGNSSFKRTVVHMFPKAMLDPLRHFFRDSKALLCDSAFLCIALGSVLCMMVLPLPFFVLPWWALVLRPNEHAAPWLASCLISIIGGSSLAGSVVSGFVADLPNGLHINVLLLHNVALFVMTVTTFMAYLISRYSDLCIYALMFGFCYSFHVALTSTVLGETVGIERLTPAFGLVTVFRGLAMLCSVPLLTLFLEKPTYCVSENAPNGSDNCPANSPNLWWAIMPNPPSNSETILAIKEDKNGFLRFLLLCCLLLLVASAVFASLHFRPGNSSGNRRPGSTRRSSSRSGTNNGSVLLSNASLPLENA